MGKDAQGSVVLNDDTQKKFDDCVAALTAMRWPDGPPKDTTFAEIEAFGHEVGRNRPGCPFQPNVKLNPTESSAA